MLFNKNQFLIILLFINILFIKGQNPPNILWLVCEDQSLFFSIYGDSTAKTPNVDQLAKNGTTYKNCFTTSPVCSPSRSSLITGMYPTTIGTQHMRAFKKNKKGLNNRHNQLPFYSAVPKKNYKFFTEILRANGYYCSNNSKEDYNMMKSPLAWDESSVTAHWRNKEENQPFFAVFNFNVTHESKVWKNTKKHSKKELEKINLPDIFPKEKQIKNDFLTNYENIEILDHQIGEIIAQLKRDGLYDNTIIFFFSDHGGPFPRYKRSIYDTGIQCPLVIKWLNTNTNPTNEQMVSFVDFAPTLIDLTGLPVPNYIEGVSFYNKKSRKYIFASSDRFDEFEDSRKCIRSNKFKLIINLDTTSAIGKAVNYRKQMKTMQVIDSLKENEKLKGYFSNWYSSTKGKYEFYNISNDPLELINLIGDSTYSNEIKELKIHLHNWIDSSAFATISEKQMLKEMFPNNISTLKLNNPSVRKTNSGYSVFSKNSEVSIGYRVNENQPWNIIEDGDEIINIDNFDLIMFKPGYEIFMQKYDY